VSRKGVANVAILGFGTVGRSVAKILSQRAPADLRLSYVFNRNVARKREEWVPSDTQWTEDFERVLGPDTDVIVELIGGMRPAQDFIRLALLAGKSVVTANKQVIAQVGPQLSALAAMHKCHLAFGAAVAGGVPVISSLEDGLAGDELRRIYGVLNGTCNFILTRIESSGISFSAALAEAQKRGYAEADPQQDIDGSDACAKLAILARVGFHADVSATRMFRRSICPVEAIDFQCARQLGYTIRQISRAELKNNSLLAAVEPALVRVSSPFASTEGAENVVVTSGAFGGETVFKGEGAGGDPTAVAVVSDILRIAQGTSNARIACGAAQQTHYRLSSDFSTRHYVRAPVRHAGRIKHLFGTVLKHSEATLESIIDDPLHSTPRPAFAFTLRASKKYVAANIVRQLGSLTEAGPGWTSFPIVD
jgi:homoserine dehydrogenase